MQLSLFLMMPGRSDKIINTMSRKNNKDIIMEILTDFELDHEDQDFETLKDKMLHKLNSL